MVVLMGLILAAVFVAILEIEDRCRAKGMPEVTFDQWAAAYDTKAEDEDALYSAYALGSAERRGRA